MANDKKYYAVRKGNAPGIYTTWQECKASIAGFTGAEFRSFPTEEEAQIWAAGGTRPKNMAANYIFAVGAWNKDAKIFGYGGYVGTAGKKYPVSGRGNNLEVSNLKANAGEIAGVAKAMQLAKQLGVKELTIYYTYEGVERWATGGWNAQRKWLKSYIAGMQKMQAEISVSFEQVDAKSLIKSDNLAIALARKEAGLDLSEKQTALLQKICKTDN